MDNEHQYVSDVHQEKFVDDVKDFTIQGSINESIVSERTDSPELFRARISRRIALQMILAAPVAIQPSKLFAQGRVAKPTIESQAPQIVRALRAFEEKIRTQSMQAILKNGSSEQVRHLLLQNPEIPHYERLSLTDRRFLHAHFHMGYIDEKEALERGKFSFPITSSFAIPTPDRFFSGSRRVPTYEEVMENPALMEYDGSPRFWNTIRVGKDIRISPGYQLYEARSFDKSILRRVLEGQGVEGIRSPIFPPHDQAGILPFDLEFAKKTVDLAVSVLWLRLPEKIDSDGVSDPQKVNKLRRKPEISSGMLYNLQSGTSIYSFVEQCIRESGSERNPRFAYYRDIQLRSLSRARLLVMNSSDTYHFERTMQQVGGAAVVRAKEDGTPHLIGQVLWWTYIPSVRSGKPPRIAFIVSDPESTNAAVQDKTASE